MLLLLVEFFPHLLLVALLALILVITAKDLGGQTTEANDDCGVDAANQIVGFFIREGRYQV